MAVNDADNVFVSGGNGAIAHAPLETALPTTHDEALNVAFVNVGYVSEDGVTEKVEEETKKIKAWNGDTIRTVQTGHALQYEFTMLERNDESVSMFYGDGNTEASTEITGDQLPKESYVIDCLDGDNVVRIVIPEGQIIKRGEVVYRGEEVTAFQVTIEAYPDSSNVKAYLYSGALEES